MMQPHDPIEGEYTDSELPVDAEVPKDATVADVDDGDWNDDDVVVEEVEVIEFTEADDDRPLR
jgi:hypothetical protein